MISATQQPRLHQKHFTKPKIAFTYLPSKYPSIKVSIQDQIFIKNRGQNCWKNRGWNFWQNQVKNHEQNQGSSTSIKYSYHQILNVYHCMWAVNGLSELASFITIALIGGPMTYAVRLMKSYQYRLPQLIVSISKLQKYFASSTSIWNTTGL